MKKQNPNRLSRRDFIKTSSIGAIGLTTALVSSSAESKPIERKEPGVLNESSKKLLSLFNLKYPFFQAAPGGEKLAVAIANAGGMGSIQFTWSSPDDAYETTKRLNEATTGNYYANYVLHFEPKSLDKALEAAGEVPVLVSGGISTGEDIRAAIHNGAAGVVMGTRFISTKESNLADVYRQKLLEAGANSTVYTNCYNESWDAMHRVLRNSTFLNWEAEGCPLKRNKPGEGEVIAKTSGGGNILRYSARRPVEGDTGDLESMCMYAGEGVGKINDIPSAAELIDRLWMEFENK